MKNFLENFGQLTKETMNNISNNISDVEGAFTRAIYRAGEGIQLLLLLRVSEANEVPISSHIWVGLLTFNWL